MNEILAGAVAITITAWKVIMNSQKDSLEKRFDSQSERAKRRIVYEVLGIFGVLFCAFFLIPVVRPWNLNVYYSVYIICALTFIVTQTTETAVVVLESKERALNRILQIYKENIFRIAVVQTIIYSLVAIIVCIQLYSVFSDVIVQNNISQNTLSGISIELTKEITNMDAKGDKKVSNDNLLNGTFSIGMILTIVTIIYGLWRMIVSSPWTILKRRFQKEYSLTFIVTDTEPLNDLIFINSSDNYYLCFDKSKDEHRMIFKSTIEQIIIKPLSSNDAQTTASSGSAARVSG